MKYYWLKLDKNFFQQHDVRMIESMPDGRDMVLFYIKLLAESVSHEGNLRFSDDIAYDNQMLAGITNTDISIVEKAMNLFIKLKMVEVQEDETITMTEVSKMTGSETDWAEKKREQRKLPKLTNGSRRLNAESIKLPNGTIKYIDEKRYGGNGMLVMDRAGGKCEICGSEENVVIHHNNGYSNNPEDLIVLCGKCHGKAHSKEGLVVENVHPEGGQEEDTLRPSPIRDKRQEIRDKNNKDILCREKADEVIAYLNNKLGSRYRSRDLIKARLNEGYSVEDFKTVIDKKYKQWHDDPKMCPYLRPETLFCKSHFESYLNEIVKSKQGFEQADYDFKELERVLAQ